MEHGESTLEAILICIVVWCVVGAVVDVIITLIKTRGAAWLATHGFPAVAGGLVAAVGTLLCVLHAT